jgi:hypothetical protein
VFLRAADRPLIKTLTFPGGRDATRRRQPVVRRSDSLRETL